MGQGARIGARRGAGVCAFLVTWPLAAWSPPAVAQIEWRGAAAGPRAVGALTPDESKQALEVAGAAARGVGAPRRIVVGFERPITEAERSSLAAVGVRLLAFVGGYSYFAAIEPARFDAQAAVTRAPFTAVRAIEREWKLHPDFSAGVLHPWAASAAGAKGDPGQIVQTKTGPARSQAVLAGDEGIEIAAYVLFHQDVDLDAQGLPALERHGVRVKSVLDPINGAVIELPLNALQALAEEDVIQWIEPPLPPWGGLNAENRALTGANIVQAAPYSLDGSGVDVLVYDAGSVEGHSDFAGRLVPGDAAGFSSHSTHVAGTVGGSGSLSGGLHRGMAPGCRIISFGFQWSGGSDFLYADPGDLQNDYISAINLHGADLSNNSIGNNTDSNGLPCTWQGDYGVVDALIDSIVRGSLGAPFRIVWAAGNERSGSRCNVEGFGQFYSLAPPANAKNQICVGAVNSNDDSITSFTSWGPTDDGRMRPDLCAPGCQSTGDFGVTSTIETANYASFCGTSMAAPTVTGCAALLMQDYRAQFPGAPDPRNSALKVFLTHSAVDLSAAGPDYRSGFGSARIQASIDLMRAEGLVEGEIEQGGPPATAVILVAPGTTQLKVTLAWDDAPGTPNVVPSLINDLDLVVTSPGGAQAFPWTLDPLVPTAAAVRTVRNSRDNIEQVVVDNPQPGSWLVEVRAFDVPEGPQPFSVVATPGLLQCSDVGIVAFGSPKSPCAGTATIRVVDCGLDSDPETAESVQVHATSTSDPVGLSVLLTEQAASSPEFVGSVSLSSTGGSGTLAGVNGDTISVVYADADTGGGSPGVASADAIVDCVPAIVSDVTVFDVQAHRATVSFSTNEPCSPTVRYGLSCGALTSIRDSEQLGTTHTLHLTGLFDNAAYFLSVEALDEAGNVSIDDNFGDCFSFVTPESIDSLTEQYDPLADDLNDLDFRGVAFIPIPGPEGYAVCAYPIAGLPTNPAGGATLSLPDDEPGLEVNLTGGKQVSLFGVYYSSFYVNPNGNITFGFWDSDPVESLTDHFERPRISALFDDIDPSEGGQVSWKQLSDRVVVTFLDVPQWNVSDQNTFQMELYFDGRIVFNYLRLDLNDGLTGLSSGEPPAEFAESDFSEYNICPPLPPRAVDATATTSIAQSIDLNLSAFDDGLPDPPGGLRYTITSLPLHGLLTDPNHGLVSVVPHTLISNTNVVSYSPLGLFQGLDTFNFKVNDYGEPPGGGDSNSATQTVQVGSIQTLHAFLLDNQNPGWVAEPAWAFGQPTGQGGFLGGGFGNPDPFGGFSGSNVLGYNLNGNYVDALFPVRYLTSTAINCSSASRLAVQYYRWLGVEHSNYDHATFEISTDGLNWTLIWENPPAFSMNPSGWELDLFDIAQHADGAATLYLRWGMGPTDNTVDYCGWNLDDISIRGLQPRPPCLGDGNLDSVVNFFDTLVSVSNWGLIGATQREGDTNADGIVDFRDILTTLANFGTTCP